MAVELRKSDDNISQLNKPLDIFDMIQAAAIKVGYDGDLAEIYELARECDEEFIEFPDIDQQYAQNLDFSQVSDELTKQVKQHELTEEGSQELKDQLREYWQGDVLASVIEQIYNVIIANVILTAGDMGIGIIQLETDIKDVRFPEKMSKELAKLDTELILL